MSSEDPIPTSAEIDRRLRIVSELRNLCVSLGRARPWAEPANVEPPATGREVLPEPTTADGKSAEVAP